MDTKTLEKLTELKDSQAVLIGRVNVIGYNDRFKTDVLRLEMKNGLSGYIKREDLDIRETKQSLVPFVGKQVKFIIKEILDDGTLICSRKEIKEAERDALLQKLEAGEEMDATITHIERYGGYLTIDDVSVMLRNMDFSNDHTILKDKHKVGDKIRVKFLKKTSTGRILVEAVEKYCNPTQVDFSTFEKNQVVLGRVRTIKTWGCYVCIAPNLDALAPIPEDIDMELEEGMSVRFKISKVDEENHHIRGKVLEIIDENDDFDLTI